MSDFRLEYLQYANEKKRHAKEMELMQGQRNMTDAERMQQSLQQRGITADPAPDYTEDGLMAIEGDE